MIDTLSDDDTHSGAVSGAAEVSARGCASGTRNVKLVHAETEGDNISGTTEGTNIVDQRVNRLSLPLSREAVVS